VTGDPQERSHERYRNGKPVDPPARFARARFRRRAASGAGVRSIEDEAIDRAAADILADVRRRGDAAVLEYTRRFDRMEAASMAALELSQSELEAALEASSRSAAPRWKPPLPACAPTTRRKIECGSHSWEYTEADGTMLGQKVTPLDRVGLYVPGGKAAYPSSVLMNAIPARVAGVKEVIMVVPTPGGVPNWCWPPRRSPASIACSPSAARRPWARWPTAPPRCRRSTRSSARAMPTWPRPSAACSARSAST
jgi:hypothetical protein